METDAEKRNLGQIATPSFVGVPTTEPAARTMPLISLELSDTESLNFTHIYTGSTTLYGYKNFSFGGVQGGQHPLVKVWDTVYISETIRARKSKIFTST